jgi:uncharacterized protein
MDAISDEDIRQRINRDNPWWAADGYESPEQALPARVYFQPFKSLALNFEVRRATVLLGPRRVGKTVMIKQLINEAVRAHGISRTQVLYVSVDAPVYLGISLEKFLSYMPPSNGDAKRLVVFDEIQYLRDWEVHLKDLVDNFPNTKFVASGSAAAALQLKSRESGAGRFTDFMLPPLTFYEFLTFINEGEKFIVKDESGRTFNYKILNIDALNSRFIDYLNYGGYPEAVFNEQIRNNPEQFIKNDIIDKVLLKDLPSLYGITGIQELNKLFSFLAYNAGTEASFENISQQSGITKPTIKRYIEYLQSAFLIIKVNTVDDNCKAMKRERNFKVYLNNPSMRAALFTPVKEDQTTHIGHLTESAIFSQWQHFSGFSKLKYARWRNEGEVDIVYLGGAANKPIWIGEIKWSDRITRHWEEETRGLTALLRRHPSITDAFITTKTAERRTKLEERTFDLIPSAAYCYIVGRNVTATLDKQFNRPKVEVVQLDEVDDDDEEYQEDNGEEGEEGERE